MECMNRFLQNILLVVIVAMAMPNEAVALHIKGGWISYTFLGREANGNLRYGFTVKVFRDCGPQSPGQNDPFINLTVFRNRDNSSAGGFIATLSRNYRLEKTTFSPCIRPIPEVCYVILEYFGTVTLPPESLGYTVAFQRCCRIGGIVNIGGSTSSQGNTYTIRLPGTNVNASFVENSSPVFVEKDTAVVCFNSSFSLDFSASDPDGDSLVYSFASALGGGSTTNPAPAVAPPPPYNPLSYAAGFAADNPFGQLISINPRTGLITGISGSQIGEYVVAVKIDEYRNGTLIAETLKELHVAVTNCSAPSADLPLEAINCDGFDVTFENRALSPAITSYFWDFGVPGINADTSIQPRPTFSYPDTGVYIAKLVVNREQQCSDSATMVVRVFPGFAPGFEADGSCYSNPFQFRDTTSARYGAVNSWRWDFGNTAASNDTSRLRNPAYTYPAPGTYTITFRATSTKGCDRTITVPLAVLDSPRLILPFRDTLICSIDSLQLRAEGAGIFNWTPATGRIFNAGTATPTVYPTSTTTYTVSLNDRGCVARDTLRVNVLDFITVDAGRDTTICRGDPITLRPITAGLSFSWSPSITLSDSSIRNPLATPTDSITVYRVIANLGKCQDTDTVTIRTVPYPIARTRPDTSLCFGDAIDIVGIGNGPRFEWSPRVGLTQPLSLLTRAAPSATTRYYLRVFDDLGCPKPGIDSVLITIIAPIQVNAGRDTSIVFGQTIPLQASSTGSIFQWIPATGLNNPTVLSPQLTVNQGTFPSGTDRIIYTLRSSTPEGCVAEDDVSIRIFSTGPSVFVPNAFTPNADGLNDVFRPILAGIEKLDFFRIFNRYGTVIFETNNAETGWDGSIKGSPQGSGTFVYQVQAVDFDGNIIKQGGTFVLIR